MESSLYCDKKSLELIQAMSLFNLLEGAIETSLLVNFVEVTIPSENNVY